MYNLCVAPAKAIVNGQLVIIKNGVQYNAQVLIVREGAVYTLFGQQVK